MVEEGANALWPSGEAAHVVDDSLLELPLAAGERPGGDRLLDIAVQAFVRVEVWAVGREVENFDLILTSVQPRAHQSCPVHLQAVEDEENLAAGAADQALEEADQARRLDRAVEHHPTQLASIGHRRDQADIGPPGRPPSNLARLFGPPPRSGRHWPAGGWGEPPGSHRVGRSSGRARRPSAGRSRRPRRSLPSPPWPAPRSSGTPGAASAVLRPGPARRPAAAAFAACSPSAPSSCPWSAPPLRRRSAARPAPAPLPGSRARSPTPTHPASAAGSGPGPPPPALPSADSRVLAPAHAAGFSAPPGHAPQSACKCQRPRSGSARPGPRSPHRSAPPGAAQSPAAVAPLAPPASGSACLRASLFRLSGDSRQIPQEHRSRLNNVALIPRNAENAWQRAPTIRRQPHEVR